MHRVWSSNLLVTGPFSQSNRSCGCLKSSVHCSVSPLKWPFLLLRARWHGHGSFSLAVCLPNSGEEDALNNTTSLMDWKVAWCVWKRTTCFRHSRSYFGWRPRRMFSALLLRYGNAFRFSAFFFPQMRLQSAMSHLCIHWLGRFMVGLVHLMKNYQKILNNVVNKTRDEVFWGPQSQWGTSVQRQLLHFRFSATNCTGQLSPSLAVKEMHCNSKSSLWFLQYWHILPSTWKIWLN